MTFNLVIAKQFNEAFTDGRGYLIMSHGNQTLPRLNMNTLCTVKTLYIAKLNIDLGRVLNTLECFHI